MVIVWKARNCGWWMPNLLSIRPSMLTELIMTQNCKIGCRTSMFYICFGSTRSVTAIIYSTAFNCILYLFLVRQKIWSEYLIYISEGPTFAHLLTLTSYNTCFWKQENIRGLADLQTFQVTYNTAIWSEFYRFWPGQQKTCEKF